MKAYVRSVVVVLSCFFFTLYKKRCLTMRVSSSVDLRPNRGLRSGRAARVVMKRCYNPLV